MLLLHILQGQLKCTNRQVLQVPVNDMKPEEKVNVMVLELLLEVVPDINGINNSIDKRTDFSKDQRTSSSTI